METNETPAKGAGTEIAAESAADVSGGDCGTTVTVGTSGTSVSTTSGSPGDAFIAIYDGAVAATSHVIETVANSLK
ncbi:MAG TPA: hypothetical protein VLY46_11770 [Usitatibacter sp.]|nr:hypothetical protein [Usitatibacter sp.]